MTALRANDPIYYKAKLQALLDKAKDNGLAVSISGNRLGTGIFFQDQTTGEIAGVLLDINRRD